MNVNEVFESVDGRLITIGWRCSNCKTIHTDKEKAVECCVPVKCSVCGRELSTDKTKCREYYYHDKEGNILCCDCHRKRIEDSWPTITEEEYWNKVHEENSDYGPVVCGDRWYTDLAEAVEEISTDDWWTCPEDIKQLRFQVGQILKPVQMHIDRLVEWETEDLNLEDPDCDTIWKDLPELYKFMEEWNKKQTFRIWDTRNMWVTLSDKTIEDNFEFEEQEV